MTCVRHGENASNLSEQPPAAARQGEGKNGGEEREVRAEREREKTREG